MSAIIIADAFWGDSGKGKIAAQAGHALVQLEIPLLFELGMESQFDAVIVISTDRELRIKRLMLRDQVTRDEAEKLISVQMPEAIKAQRAQFVVPNNGSKKQLIMSVDRLYKNILKMSKKDLKSLDSQEIMI